MRFGESGEFWVAQRQAFRNYSREESGPSQVAETLHAEDALSG